MSTLCLTLNKKWFDMIESGEKTDEYREIKPYWETRLCTTVTKELPFPDFKTFDQVFFKNGYAKGSRTMTFECTGITIGLGCTDWGAERNKQYFIIHLGKKI